MYSINKNTCLDFITISFRNILCKLFFYLEVFLCKWFLNQTTDPIIIILVYKLMESNKEEVWISELSNFN